MYLITGLGNPDKKYVKTRHNVGFMALDFLQKKLLASDFKKKISTTAITSEKKISGEKIILMKPLTYMNNSGAAVSAIKKYYKIPLNRIIIIYDELDLPFCKIRVRSDGSSAGHKGVQSIIDKLGGNNFWRVRIGINVQDKKMTIEDFVLSQFSEEEIKLLQEKAWGELMVEVMKIIEGKQII